MNRTNSIRNTGILAQKSKQKKTAERSMSNAQLAFNIMFILIWVRHTVLSFVLQALYYIPYVQRLANYVFPAAIVFLGLLSLPYIKKHIRLADVLFFLIGLLILVVAPAIWPDNAEYLNDSTWQIITSVLPLYLVGVCYDHASLKKSLFYASLIGCGTMLLYQIYQLALGRILIYDGMGQAYYLLPSVMYLIYWAFEKNKIKYWVFALIGTVFVSSFGTRGPILVMLVFFAARFFIKVIKTKSGIVKFLFIIGAFLGIFVVISGDLLVNVAEFLSEKLGNMGFSTRVFDYFLDGNITEGSGRSDISATVLEAIKTHPAFGYGLMGDRVIIGNYAHNLFLELWCQFGVVFGTILALVMIFIPVSAVKKQKDAVFSNFLLMLSCTVLVKLMGSSSFILEPHLFLLIGISIASLRQSKAESLKEGRHLQIKNNSSIEGEHTL